MKGIVYLQKKLDHKRSRGNLRYRYYEQKQTAKDLGISTPEGLEWFTTINGWCTKAVDNLADRLQFDKFDNDNFGFTEMFNQNNPDIFYSDAMLSSLITSCSFVYITRGGVNVADDVKKMRFQVIDGCNATGEIDDFTKLLLEGYAVLERDNDNKVVTYAYFQPGRTEVYHAGDKEPFAVETFNSRYCALVPIIYRPDAKRPFGHSRISRACMDYAKSAMRTIKRSELAAEFYSVPMKFVSGLSPDAEMLDRWQASMSAMLTFTKDDEGDKPTVGQFQMASFTPHLEQLKAIASMFAGETGLTLDDLGFVTSNPSSADAIKAAHEGLRLTCEKAQRCFSVGFLNVGYIGACIRDNADYQREELFETKVIWKPTFSIDASMLGILGDSMLKLSQVAPNFFTEETLHRLTGI